MCVLHALWKIRVRSERLNSYSAAGFPEVDRPAHLLPVQTRSQWKSQPNPVLNTCLQVAVSVNRVYLTTVTFSNAVKSNNQCTAGWLDTITNFVIILVCQTYYQNKKISQQVDV